RVAVVDGGVHRLQRARVGELGGAGGGGDAGVVVAGRADSERLLPAGGDHAARAGRAGDGPGRRHRPQLRTGPAQRRRAGAHRGGGSSDHSRATPPQVAPEPKATETMRSPRRSRPVRSASASASGIEALEVLPKRSPLKNTRSMPTPSRFAVASTMRRLAWWGMTWSTSSTAQPASAPKSTQVERSP